MSIDKVVRAGDIFESVHSAILDRKTGEKELPIVSLPGLDEKVWGLHKRQLVIVGGRPSQGKSALLLQLAFDFAIQGKTVVLFTLEMSNETCIERLLCSYCSIDNFLTLSGQYAQEAGKYSAKVTELHGKLKESKLILIESYGKTFDEIFKILEGLEMDIDCVFIDYIQMIRPKDRQTKKDAIDDYLKRLRDHAMRKNFCAVIGSQVNRGTHDGHKVRKPSLWELKGSGDLEEHSDLCLMVHWNYFYTSEEHERQRYWINIAKNRNGKTGEYDCIFECEYYKIRECNETERISQNREQNRPTEGMD